MDVLNEQKERMISKIEKLLALADNNSNEEEMQSAMLKAQALMAQYNIKMGEIGQSDYSAAKIIHLNVGGKTAVAPWKKLLASIIAKNFRCRIYYLKYKGLPGVNFVFLGFDNDATIACAVFKFAVAAAEKGMYKCYRKFRDAGKFAKGIRHDYVSGFISGLKNKFEEQVTQNEWGLVLVVPKEVNAVLDGMDLGNVKESKARFHMQFNREASEMGFRDGKNFNTDGPPKELR